MGNQLMRRMGMALAVLLILTGITAAAYTPQNLIPVGRTVGIELKSDGVMIVGLGEVQTQQGKLAPGINAGLLPGDVITQVGDSKISSIADLKSAIEAGGAEAVTIRAIRGEQTLQLNLTPAQDANGHYELGLWLRDSMAGIGTVTFFDPESGKFGALGHPVVDAETGTLMPLGEGHIMPAAVRSVRRGEASAPGELQGEFEFARQIGTLSSNTAAGIFGEAIAEDLDISDKIFPVGDAKEIKTGAATILSNVNGREIQEFEIEISRIFAGDDGRNLMLTVTDTALLDATGGIVQGMSGSPILQDGKLIGAVTHVLINNPEKGYGISIDNMLRAAFTDIDTAEAAAA